jgi:hypothetical protein
MRENALIPEGECFVTVFAYAGEVAFRRYGQGLVYGAATKAGAFA